ncbi:Tox-REase-5 domain-containing protein [Archangium violaceum]|uniref:Tox-REase-5 domain-containing protein n=1 Tax=Archangium violaceum TaxID=83451 RepID=UPI001EF00D20|nr:Tox-REase-5 domain-containing protein [Archangium violaceum]
MTQRNFAPLRALSLLLREVLTGGKRVGYAELVRRTERFRHLVMVRPDGYLVTTLHGEPIQRLGAVKLEDGEFKVLRLVVGAFYFSHGGVLYPVNEALQRRDTSPWAEVGLGRDPLNAALDGAQEAMGELALALAQSILHPIRSAEGLTQLPTTVARLIASSPEYFARFGAMSLQDQIREAARLSTHLLMMYGGAAGTVGTVGRIGPLGSELPVLSLTATGELSLSTVVVSAGTLTTTLGAGVGAVSILHMSVAGNGGWPPMGGPGQWVEDTSSMSERSRAYQAQVTGAPKGWCYKICRNGRCVEYDGYDPKTGTLLEAKGEGYDHWFKPNLEPLFEFEGLEGLERQARRQTQLAGGLRVRWHVAQPRMVPILQKLFSEWGVKIEVEYTQPRL